MDSLCAAQRQPTGAPRACLPCRWYQLAGGPSSTGSEQTGRVPVSSILSGVFTQALAVWYLWAVKALSNQMLTGKIYAGNPTGVEGGAEMSEDSQADFEAGHELSSTRT